MYFSSLVQCNIFAPPPRGKNKMLLIPFLYQSVQSTIERGLKRKNRVLSGRVGQKHPQLLLVRARARACVCHWGARVGSIILYFDE
jgi:hypothetical protein